MPRIQLRWVAAICTAWLVLGGCSAAGDSEGSVTLYTSVTQETVDAVVAAFAVEHGEIDVEVFRAPTGERSNGSATRRSVST